MNTDIQGNDVLGPTDDLQWVSFSAFFLSRTLTRLYAKRIDCEAGTCGMYASQLVPPGDEQSAELFGDFQRAVFRAESQA